MGHTLGTLGLIDDPLTLYRIEYATIALGMPLIALYVIKLIEREESNDKPAHWLAGIGGILLLCCMTLDVYSIMSILTLYQVFIAVTVLYLIQHLWFAIREGNQIAKWFGWAFGALVFTIVHDILYTLEIIANTTFIIPAGFTAFILAQAIIISHISASKNATNTNASYSTLTKSSMRSC